MKDENLNSVADVISDVTTLDFCFPCDVFIPPDVTIKRGTQLSQVFACLLNSRDDRLRNRLQERIRELEETAERETDTEMLAHFEGRLFVLREWLTHASQYGASKDVMMPPF